MRDLIGSAAKLLAMSWRQSRARTVVAAALLSLAGVAGPVLALTLRTMVDSALSGRVTAAVTWGVLTGAVTIAVLTLTHFAYQQHAQLSELNVMTFSQELIEISNGSPGVAHHDSPGFADRIVMLEQKAREFAAALNGLLSSLGLLLGILLTALLLAAVHPALLLLPMLAVPPLLAGHRAERVTDAAQLATAEQTRRALGHFMLATSGGPAKELRVYGMGDELLRRHRTVWDAVSARLLWAEARAVVLRASGQLIFAAGYVGAVLLVVSDVVSGHRTVGDVVLVVVLAGQVSQQLVGALALIQDLQRMASAFRRMAETRMEVAAPPGPPVDQPAPERLTGGIELVGVDFGYPGSLQMALESIDLYLPAGSTVALVGENGAGKSTLVNLLCGLYQPSRGRVAVDGVDLRSIPLDRWRSRIAVGFQDFARLELPARLTVGVGDLMRSDEESAVASALARAGATSVVERLRDGLNTQLGKSYGDGVELSSGQWQRLALARAFMRQAPLLLVLDEPTSAIDAEAEHDLFERVAAQAASAARSSGGITLLVSHRFSTVRSADLIVVLAHHTVAEIGSHDELVARGGLYAELYQLQALAFH